MRRALDASGFVLCPSAVGQSARARLLAACNPPTESARVRHPGGVTYGIRGLLWSSPLLASELDASGLTALAAAALGRAAFPIDAIFFDKRQDANWNVPGHQDRVMPVWSTRREGIWRRHGIDYGEPAEETLAALLALRVHFDEVGADDGPLEVVPGSHRRGLLGTEAVRSVEASRYEACPAAAGDVLLMRPLLLHRSRRKIAPGPRRVLHVVYAIQQPEDGLQWRAII